MEGSWGNENDKKHIDVFKEHILEAYSHTQRQSERDKELQRQSYREI